MMTVLWLFIGGAIGAIHVITMWWTVARLQPDAPHQALAWVLGGAALRWAITGGLLCIALRTGAGPGLLAVVGLWLGRWGTVRWLRLNRKSRGVVRF
jgi:hypothetical protein